MSVITRKEINLPEGLENALRSEKDLTPEVDRMMTNARAASEFLKALAHENRLLLLCLLSARERSVTELENLLSMRQPAVSQQLARLRLDGLVEARREGKAIYYSVADEGTRQVIALLYDMFCSPDGKKRRA